VADYLLNVGGEDAAPEPGRGAQTAQRLRLGMWGVDAGERHRDALAEGDRVLVYLAPPERAFAGRAELASAVRDWTRSEAKLYPGGSSAGVLLRRVEEWDPPVPMDAVLARIDSPQARADFEKGVVRITADEFEAAVAVAAERAVRDPRA